MTPFFSRCQRRRALGALALAPLLLASCLYTNIVTTLDEDVGNTLVASKRGEATSRSFLWLVAFGDAGIQTAARAGELTRMHQADEQIISVLFGLYYSRTTIVYGE